VRAAVRDLPEAKVSVPHGRVVVYVADQARAEACSRLERVFGLVSISPVASVGGRHRRDLRGSRG